MALSGLSGSEATNIEGSWNWSAQMDDDELREAYLRMLASNWHYQNADDAASWANQHELPAYLEARLRAEGYDDGDAFGFPCECP